MLLLSLQQSLNLMNIKLKEQLRGNPVFGDSNMAAFNPATPLIRISYVALTIMWFSNKQLTDKHNSLSTN